MGPRWRLALIKAPRWAPVLFMAVSSGSGPDIALWGENFSASGGIDGGTARYPDFNIVRYNYAAH
jgi:hypothetical protein